MQKDWNDFKILNKNIEGARAAFEIVCESLFRKKYPQKEVQIIRANPGDDGIDVIIGEMNKKPIIVQCKFFLNNIDNTQKNQIRKSFVRAVTSKLYKFSEWKLCITTNLTSKECKWWSSWKESQCSKYDLSDNQIQLINGSTIIEELKEFNLYNNYFEIEQPLLLERLLLKINDLYEINNENSERNKILTITKNKLDEIYDNVDFFIQHFYCDIIKEILNKNNCCIISGSPGVGKTVTAESICLEYINEGYDFYFLNNNIDNFDQLYNEKKQQVFLFDDFLGRVVLSRTINEDYIDRLSHFIKKIITGTSAKIILTSREYILNQGTIEYELKHRFFSYTKKCTIEFTEYDVIEKTEILISHLKYNNIPKDALHSITQYENYLDIIFHDSFSPRIIELMTTVFIKESEKRNESYFESFIRNLDNPSEIWNVVFNKITDISKEILIILAFHDGDIIKEKLEKELFELNGNMNMINISTQIDHALYELNKSMLSIISYQDETYIQYLNPSVFDYILNYLNEHTYLLKKYIKFYNESLPFFFQIFSISSEKNHRLIKPVLLYPKIELYVEENIELILDSFSIAIDYTICQSRKSQKIFQIQYIKTIIEVFDKYSNFSDNRFFNFSMKYLSSNDLLTTEGIFLILDSFRHEKERLCSIIKTNKSNIRDQIVIWNTFNDAKYFGKILFSCKGEIDYTNQEIKDIYRINKSAFFDSLSDTFSLETIDDAIDIIENMSLIYDFDCTNDVKKLEVKYEKISDQANSYNGRVLDEEIRTHFISDEDDYEVSEVKDLFFEFMQDMDV